jgi:hypothetical protein
VLEGELAYVADGASGLQVVDVSVPTAPVIIGHLDTPGFAWGISVGGGHAYIADGSGMMVADVGAPTAPAIVGSVDGPPESFSLGTGAALDLYVSGGLVYLVDGQRGLQILPTQCSVAAVETPSASAPARNFLEASWPNPFRDDSGSVAIGFVLGESSRARVHIYDSAGRSLRILVDESLDQGRHVVRWDGRNDGGADVPSGVYYYRLEVGELSESRALVRIR